MPENLKKEQLGSGGLENRRAFGVAFAPAGFHNAAFNGWDRVSALFLTVKSRHDPTSERLPG
jgi:hypothetical protein